MAMMWEGRFSKPASQILNEFNASITFDQRMASHDIHGSLAHAAMLEKQGIISKQDYEDICSGLYSILDDIALGKIVFDAEHYEDIHMAVEEILTNRIGQAGKRLHTGRSRNDQTAVDLRMYTRDAIKTVQEKTCKVISVLCDLAKENRNTILPGYTHLQRAQPVSFAHVLMAYANMLKRDVKRMDNTLELMDECPLGSGALAGTTYPLDRDFTANLLGFSAPCANSLDGVSDRDYAAEAIFDWSVEMMHLSRLSEEIILWCSWEFKFIELDDAYATGSSIMPQKKNPDICELIRGKTGRVYGHLMGLLTVLKGLPLAYNKDMQEDKEALFDAYDTVSACLHVLAPMLETMTVNKDKMRQAAAAGFINATDLADYLTKKGLPFREAYKITGQVVAWAGSHHKVLEELTLEELKPFSPMFEADFAAAVDLDTCMAQRKTCGGPAPEQTLQQILQIQEFLNTRQPQ